MSLIALIDHWTHKCYSNGNVLFFFTFSLSLSLSLFFSLSHYCRLSTISRYRHYYLQLWQFVFIVNFVVVIDIIILERKLPHTPKYTLVLNVGPNIFNSFAPQSFKQKINKFFRPLHREMKKKI